MTGRAEKKPATLALLLYSWIGYAAAILLLTSFGVYFFNWEKDSQEEIRQVSMIEKSNPRGTRTILTLSDGSVVYLGAESRIKYTEHFAGAKREVFLEGEAFFEIRHNREKPFIVHSGKVQTQVLGTSFKVEAFRGQRLAVSVATGKVSVGYRESGSKLNSL